MPHVNPNHQGEPDHRFLSLLLFCATRADLLGDYLASNNAGQPDEARWAKLQELGMPHHLLAESLHLFKDLETQKALKQIQHVAQTMIELNDYCFHSCPTDDSLREQSWLGSKQTISAI
jgi:hypothetical protein